MPSSQRLLMRLRWPFAAAILLGATGPSAFAITNFAATDLSGLTDAAVDSLVKTVAISADHRAYMPASPLGMTLGVDIGIEATYIPFPAEFAGALALATGKAQSELPSGLPLPKVSVHKGLPWGLDFGFSLMALPGSSGSGGSVFSSYGGDVKWAFLRGPVAPNVAVRLSGSYNKLYFLSTHSYSVDVIASKSFIVLEPFIGGGLQMWSGDVSVSGTVQGLPVGIAGHRSGTTPRVFGGLALNLPVLRLTAQADASGAGITTFGGKVSFGF